MRVLATSTPGIGHINSLLPLTAALRDAGHEVLIVTAAESCELIEHAGFAVREGGMSARDRRASFEPRLAEVMALPPRERRAFLFSGFFADAAAPAMRVDLRPIFDEFRPDIVIHERAELAAAALAQARGVRHLTVAFSGSLPASSEQLVINSLEPLWAAEGLPAPTMDQINGDLYLHPFPPSFGQPPASGDVRPMRAVAFGGANSALPPWLDALGTKRPLIYLTAGTEPLSAMFPWEAAVEALRGLDVDAVATIGAHLDVAVFGAVPLNIRVERFVPQRFVLDRASAVMSHAGAGSVLGAAGCAVPQVLAPLHADQWENADAATGAGVAITLEVEQRSAGDIAAAIVRVLDDALFEQASARVATEIASMPLPADHVGTIEALADRNTSD